MKIPTPPNNPNNTDTWSRRHPQNRELDNDGVDNRASDADYFGNLEKFKRTDDMAAAPSRDTTPPKNR